MKKLFILGAMALATLSMSAQDFTGKWFIGGTAGYGQKNVGFDANNKAIKDKTYGFKPLIGTFIAPDIAVGARIGWEGSEKNETEAGISGVVKANDFVVAPMVRKYIPLGDSGFNFFGELALPVSFGDSKLKNVKDSKTSNFGIGLKLNAGFDYIINETLSFETSMNLANFGYTSSKPKGGKRSSDMNINVDPFQKLNLFEVGFKVLF